MIRTDGRPTIACAETRIPRDAREDLLDRLTAEDFAYLVETAVDLPTLIKESNERWEDE